MKTWKELAEDALAIQDACNLSGVVISFAQVVKDVRALLEAEGKASTQLINNHPVCRLWADKIAALTDTQMLGHDNVGHAYRWAFEQVGLGIA